MTGAQGHGRLVRRLLLSAVLMFGFGFALVPLYDVFCEVTGLNGKISNTGPITVQSVDQSRVVRVRLLAVHNEGMPWAFHPQQSLISTHPGEMQQTAFMASNPTARPMVAQAIPSVSPSEAARYLHKVNCFCFEQQRLMAGESIKMPLLFVIDPELPPHIRSITLSYTLFDISPDITATEQIEERRSL